MWDEEEAAGHINRGIKNLRSRGFPQAWKFMGHVPQEEEEKGERKRRAGFPPYSFQDPEGLHRSYESQI